MDKNIFCGVIVPCCMGDDGCVCGKEERVLRGYVRQYPKLEPMNTEQREWCLSEIDSIEGYDRKDCENYTDSDLANTVLAAWMDYCRDKGLF